MIKIGNFDARTGINKAKTVIFKYSIKRIPGVHSFQVPDVSLFLDCDTQGTDIVFWYNIDPGCKRLKTINIELVYTGTPVESEHAFYAKTITEPVTKLVYHVLFI